MQSPGSTTFTGGLRKNWKPAMSIWPGRFFCKNPKNKKLSRIAEFFVLNLI
jgi:hypothetical protein